MGPDSPLRGSWWPSTDPSRRVEGVLEPSGRVGYELKLHGASAHIAALGESTLEGVPLFGEDLQGSAITVWYLPMSALPGSSRIDLVIERAMLGVHSTNPRFSVALLSVPNLAGWSGRGGAIKPVVGSPGVGLDFSYERPGDLSAAIDGGTVVLGDSVSLSSSFDEDTVRRGVQLMVKVDEPVTFQELLGQYLRPLQHLMTFALDAGVAIRDLSLRMPSQEERVTPVFEPVLEPSEVVGSAQRPLFRLQDAPEGFESLLQKWFALYERLDPLLDLLLFQKYVSQIPFAQQRLLMYAQAAEGLHQRFDHRFTQYSLDPSHHKALMDEIQASPSDAAWARDRLQRNDPSFRQRLMDLIHYAGPAAAEILRPDPARWASRVRDVRDRWTHWSTDTETTSDGVDVRALAWGLSVVLSSCLLVELGFRDDRRDELIRGSEDFRWVQFLGGVGG